MTESAAPQPCALTAAIFEYYATSDEALLEPVFDKLRPGLRAYATRRLQIHCAEKREDMVQDTLADLLRVFRKQLYQPESKEVGSGALWSFAYRALTWQFTASLKKKNPSAPGFSEEPFQFMANVAADETDDAEYGISHEQASQLVGAVTRAVLALDTPLRICIILVYYQNMNHREAAAVLGITKDVFHRRHAEGMKALQRWAKRNPQFRPGPEMYAALSGVNTGTLFRVKTPAPEPSVDATAAAFVGEAA